MVNLRAVFFDLGDTLVDLGEGRGDYEARLVMRMGRVYEVLAAAGVALPEREAFCHAAALDSEAQYHAALVEQRGIDIYVVLRRFLAQRGIPADDGLVAACGDVYCAGGGATLQRCGRAPVIFWRLCAPRACASGSSPTPFSPRTPCASR